MLHHLVTTAARTSSRSLFAKSNTPAYVSSLRMLAGQEESRLRHLFPSAARSSSRLLFTKPNASICVSSLRTYADQKVMPEWVAAQKRRDEQRRHDAKMSPSEVAIILAFIATAVVLLGFSVYWDKRHCTITFQPMLATSDSEPVGAAVESTKKPDPFEGAKVTLNMSSPKFFPRMGTIVILNSSLRVSLPNMHSISPESSDFKEICDGLERQGIQVERTKEGVRTGLAKYALKLMHHAVILHYKKKGSCGHFPVHEKKPEAPKTKEPIRSSGTSTQLDHSNGSRYVKLEYSDSAPIPRRDPFEGAKVRLTLDEPLFRSGSGIRLESSVFVTLPNLEYFEYIKPDTPEFKKICDGLERQGFHVERTKEGVHRGLTEYALKQMFGAYNLHFKKNGKCGDFTITNLRVF